MVPFRSLPRNAAKVTLGTVLGFVLALSGPVLATDPGGTFHEECATGWESVTVTRTEIDAVCATQTTNPTPTPFPTVAPTATPAPTAPPTPPPSSPSGKSYGTVALDTKANMPIGPWGRIVHTFRAGTTSQLEAIRWPQRWGTGGYSGGNGGTIRIGIHADNGGKPGPELSALTYVPGNQSANSLFLQQTFPSPASLTEGTLYHVVFTNVDPNPTTNWISINNMLNWEPDSPRQPTYSDEFAVLSGRGGPDTLEDHYLAVMDLTYANGHHDGQGYIQAMRDYPGKVSGSNRVRQTITPTQTMTFSEVGVRVLRDSGSAPLTISLAGKSANVTAPIGDETNNWEPSGYWATAPLDVTLQAGQTYELVLSTSPSTTYYVIPAREGENFHAVFGDGGVEKSSGGSWSPLYLWSPVDMQFFLR